MRKGEKGKGTAGDHDHKRRKGANAVGRLVKERKHLGKTDHENADSRSAGHGKGDHLAVGVLCPFDLSCSQLIANHNGNGASQRKIYDREQVDDGRGNIDLSKSVGMFVKTLPILLDCRNQNVDSLDRKSVV